MCYLHNQISTFGTENLKDIKSHMHRVQSLTGAVHVRSRKVNAYEPINARQSAYKVVVKTVQS
jgi:hypothetical protein